MKRGICLILVLCLILPLYACSGETPQVPGTFYYRRAETAFDTIDGVTAPEQVELAGIRSDLSALFRAYFDGPKSPDLDSPFPRDTRVLSWEIQSDTLMLTMNDAFAAMSGIELTIACACIARTFLELLPVTQVQFQANNALLGGEKSLTFSADNISLADDCLDQARAVFTVYYTDRQLRYLIAQDVSINLATESDPVRRLVELLMTPPEGSTLYSAIPADTKLLDYSIDDGLCTINFSAELERNGWGRCEAQRLTLLSVVNTLTQLEQIQEVEFCIEGNLLVQYRLLNISAPLVFDENAIGPVRTGMNEFDATLYLANGGGDYLAAVPTRIRQTGGLSEEELVVEALLEHSGFNGFYSTIPEGTVLNHIYTKNGTCYVDLSAEFLGSETHLTQSVHSIIASVCSVENIRSVQITVDGTRPEGEYADLFAVLSPQSDWFL